MLRGILSMAIKAELADGTVLEFPDGTSTNVIQSTVKSQTGGTNHSLITKNARDSKQNIKSKYFSFKADCLVQFCVRKLN